MTLIAALAATVLALSTDSGGDDPVARSPIELPLTLAEAGLGGGEVEAVGATEGPDARSYCDNDPAVDGLLAWNGNRLTAPGGERRVAQTVIRFQSSVHATAYLAANSDLVDCEGWDGFGPDAVRYTVAEASPEQIFGDETKRFDLTATRSSTQLHLRTVLIRSGAVVVQLTLVSTEADHLDDLDRLTELATADLGF